VLLKTGIMPDLGTVALLVTASGIAGAIALFWAVRNTPLKFLFERPAWQSCKTSRNSRSSRRSSAAPLDSVMRGRKPHMRPVHGQSIRIPRLASREEGRSRLSGRRLVLHFPRLSRAAAAQPQVGRLQVNAVLGFCNMLWKLMRDMKPEDKPTHLAVIFDKSEKTFRNELYKDYKAHRPGRGRPISFRSSR